MFKIYFNHIYRLFNQDTQILSKKVFSHLCQFLNHDFLFPFTFGNNQLPNNFISLLLSGCIHLCHGVEQSDIQQLSVQGNEMSDHSNE